MGDRGQEGVGRSLFGCTDTLENEKFYASLPIDRTSIIVCFVDGRTNDRTIE